MASLSERLQWILDVDAKGAVRGFQQAGKTADAELKKVESRVDKFGSTMTKVGAGALAFAGVAGAGLVKLGMGASDLSESINAVDVTFGDAAAGVLKLGENAAKAVGLSRSEFNGLAVQFSSFVSTVAGEGGDVVARMDELTKRTADFASVMNLDVPEAARIFQSALAGETEPIKKFGIDLSAASVAAYAVANGISSSAASMTEAEKVQARYGLLMESTAKTAGDFANTSDGLANRQRILKAEMKNLADGIGTGLLPMMETIVGAGSKVVGVFTDLDPSTQALIGKFAGLGVAAVGALGALSFITGQAIKMRHNLAPLIDRLRDAEGGFTRMGRAASAAGVVAGVAFSAWALNSAHAAKNQAEFNNRLQEMSRMEGDELWNNLVVAIGQGVIQGKSADETFAELARTSLGAAQRVVELADAHGGYITVGGKSIEVSDAMRAAVEAEAKAQRQVKADTDAATAAIDGNTAATEESTASIEEQRRALETLFSEKLKAIDKEYAFAQSQRDAAAASDRLNETLTDQEATQREVENATEDARQAAVRQAIAYAEANGAAVNTEHGVRMMIGSLREQANALAPGSALRVALEGYIAKLESVPRSINTQLNLTARIQNASAADFLAGRVYGKGASATGGFESGPTLVGEHGPEVVNLPRGSFVHTAAQTDRMLGGSYAPTYNVTVNAGMGANGREIGDVIVDQLAQFVRRNGPGQLKRLTGG